VVAADPEEFGKLLHRDGLRNAGAYRSASSATEGFVAASCAGSPLAGDFQPFGEWTLTPPDPPASSGGISHALLKTRLGPRSSRRTSYVEPPPLSGR
jgi:hypothetical protein